MARHDPIWQSDLQWYFCVPFGIRSTRQYDSSIKKTRISIRSKMIYFFVFFLYRSHCHCFFYARVAHVKITISVKMSRFIRQMNYFFMLFFVVIRFEFELIAIYEWRSDFFFFSPVKRRCVLFCMILGFYAMWIWRYSRPFVRMNPSTTFDTFSYSRHKLNTHTSQSHTHTYMNLFIFLDFDLTWLTSGYE